MLPFALYGCYFCVVKTFSDVACFCFVCYISFSLSFKSEMLWYTQMCKIKTGGLIKLATAKRFAGDFGTPKFEATKDGNVKRCFRLLVRHLGNMVYNIFIFDKSCPALAALHLLQGRFNAPPLSSPAIIITLQNHHSATHKRH